MVNPAAQNQRGVVSLTQIATVCPDKTSLYKALGRNQYYAPPLKDPLMSIDFMKGVVVYGSYWLPKADTIRIKICADPPTKIVVAQYLVEALYTC